MRNLLQPDQVCVESKVNSSIRTLLFACLLPLGGCSFPLADTVAVGCARRDSMHTTEADCLNAGNTFASGACYAFLDATADASVSIDHDPVACAQAGGQIMRFTTSSMGDNITHTVVPVGNKADSGTD